MRPSTHGPPEPLRIIDADGNLLTFEVHLRSPPELRLIIDGAPATVVKSLRWTPPPSHCPSLGALYDQRRRIGTVRQGELASIAQLANIAGVSIELSAEEPEPEAFERQVSISDIEVHHALPKLPKQFADGTTLPQNRRHHVPLASYGGLVAEASARKAMKKWSSKGVRHMRFAALGFELYMSDGRPMPRTRMLDLLWEHLEDKEKTAHGLFFSLKIKVNGGLGDEDLDILWETWYDMVRRSLHATQIVCLIVLNIAFLSLTNREILLSDDMAPTRTHFTLCSWIVQKFGSDYQGRHVVVVAELAGLAINVCMCIKYFLRIWTTKQSTKWHSIDRLLKLWLPRLSTYSAMRLLAYINPFVFMLQVSLEFDYMIDLVSHGFVVRGIWHFVRYLGTCVLALIIGVDAFLIKFAQTSEYAALSDLDVLSFARVAVFLFQLLGVTDLARFSRKRLQLFIFGRADGRVSNHEKGLQYFWNATLTKRTFRKFGFWRGLAIVLTFDDFDFQRLILSEDFEVDESAVMAMSESCMPTECGTQRSCSVIPLAEGCTE